MVIMSFFKDLEHICIKKSDSRQLTFFSCVLLMSHTWILAYNKYCTDPREEPQTSSFKGNYTLYIYNIVWYIIFPL